MGKDVAEGAGSLLGGLIGGIGGSSGSNSNSQNSSSSTTQAPWTVQQPYITSALDTAQNIYGQESSVPLPGSYVAGQNQSQVNADQGFQNYNNQYGNALNVYQPLYDSSNKQINAGQASGTNAQSIFQNGIGAQSPYTSLLGQYASTGSLAGNSGLSSALSRAATNGVSALGQSQNIANQVASTGLNASNGINAANLGALSAVNSPALANAIDGANSGLERDLANNSLTSIRQAASANANANSSREGSLEANAVANAAQQMSANASALTNQAYQTGYSGGLNSYTSGLGAANTAAGNLNGTGSTSSYLGSNLTNAQLGATNEAANDALNYQSQNTNAQLAANNQVGQAYQLGSNAAGNYSTGVNNALGYALTGGNAQQQQAQSGINNNLAAYQYATQMPSDILNNYWNIISSHLGSSGTSTSNSTTNGTTTPNDGGLASGVSGALGGLSFGNGLYRNGVFGTPLGGTDGFGTASNPWASSMI